MTYLGLDMSAYVPRSGPKWNHERGKRKRIRRVKFLGVPRRWKASLFGAQQSTVPVKIYFQARGKSRSRGSVAHGSHAPLTYAAAPTTTATIDNLCDTNECAHPKLLSTAVEISRMINVLRHSIRELTTAVFFQTKVFMCGVLFRCQPPRIIGLQESRGGNTYNFEHIACVDGQPSTFPRAVTGSFCSSVDKKL